MLKKISLLMFVLVQTTVFSQDYKFGKVSKEELEEKFHPLDSTAEAAYLYRYRRTYFDYNDKNGFEIITEIQERIKIYTPEGYKNASKIISYYNPETGDKQTVSGINAYTFNLIDGKVTKDKLAKNDIFNEEKNKFWSLQKFTMPNVKVGSVIDLEYQIRSPYLNISDVQFQFDIPVKKLEYKITIPEYYVFNMKMKGYYFVNPKETNGKSFLTINSKSRTGWYVINTSFVNTKIDFRTNVKEFSDENIPALKDNEPFVANMDNYRGGITFELTSTNFMAVGGEFKSYASTWEQVSKQIFETTSFGSELEKSGYYTDDLNKILETAKSDIEKVGAIFHFVKTKMKWNGLYSKYTDNGVRKAYKENVGNVADINLILIAMLREAGLNANPVLISSRGNGIPLFPTIEGFDYVIALVQFPDNSYVLMDATEPYSSPNILPGRTLNWQGRIIRKDGSSSWIPLTASKHALEENILIVKMTDDMAIEGLFRTKYDNLNALVKRRNENHLKEENLKTKLEEKYKIEIEDFKIGNKQETDKALIRTVKFFCEDLVEEINGKLYVEPLLFLTVRNNPFKLEERKYPVDFVTSWKDVHRVAIEIPEGYSVEKLPEPLAIALPENIGVFKYQVTQKANKISTIAILEFNSPLISPNNYPFLKDFYSKLVLKETEKIVLVKQ